jgi:L-asparaginase
VIVTGSHLPLVGHVATDAMLNLAHAVEAATLDIGEVAVAFGPVLLRGSRVHKHSEYHFDAFSTPNAPLLGEFGIRTRLTGIEVPKRSHRIELRNVTMNLKVQQLSIFPGMSPQVIEQAIAAGIKGLVIHGYGAGNVPTGHRSLLPAIARATEEGITVVISTQCTQGGVEVLYATGQAAIDAGAISAGDMTQEMTIVKLMWALGQSSSLADVRQIMERTYAHEHSRYSPTLPQHQPQLTSIKHAQEISSISVGAVASN